MDSIQGHFIGGSIEITKHFNPKQWSVRILRGHNEVSHQLILTNAELRALAYLIKGLDLPL